MTGRRDQSAFAFGSVASRWHIAQPRQGRHICRTRTKIISKLRQERHIQRVSRLAWTLAPPIMPPLTGLIHFCELRSTNMPRLRRWFQSDSWNVHLHRILTRQVGMTSVAASRQSAAFFFFIFQMAAFFRKPLRAEIRGASGLPPSQRFGATWRWFQHRFSSAPGSSTFPSPPPARKRQGTGALQDASRGS